MKIKLLSFFIVFSCLFWVPLKAQNWLWGTAGYGNILAGFPNEYGKPVATDIQGNVYITGTYLDTVKFGPLVLNDVHNKAYLVKYNSSGYLRWVFQPTGNGYCDGIAVTTDSAYDIFITGYFKDTLSFGSFTLSTTGSVNYGNSVFLAKLDPSGTVLWAKQAIVSATGNGYSFAASSDNGGNVFVTGVFGGSITFGSSTLSSPNSHFCVKYDANGNVLWAKQALPLSGNTASTNAITTDNSGNAYVTGFFHDTITFGSYSLFCANSSWGVFLVKYKTNGSIQWAKQSSGSSTMNAWGEGITTDEEGNVYVTGDFSDTVTFDRYTFTEGYLSSGIFLTKYDSNGNLIWAKQSALKNGIWIGNSLSSDNNNHIYLSGTGENSDSLQFGGYSLSVNPPQYSSFIMQLDTSGTPICGSIFKNNGASPEPNINVTSNPSGNYTYLYGTFFSDILFFGGDTLNTKGITTDPFVARWNACGLPNGISNIEDRINETNIYPNPFSTYTTIFFSASGKYTLELIDITGRKLKQIVCNGIQYQLSRDGLSTGLYFVKVYNSTGENVSVSKIVVQ